MDPTTLAVTEPWNFTVVKAQGIRHLRPEKSWRPIVELVVDQQQYHEIILGCDGQNPNLRAPCVFRGVSTGSQLEIKIWHKSQSKKKSRKRHLVAWTGMSLGELLKRQETMVELRLTCQPLTKRTNTGDTTKGRYQSCAAVHVRLCPPQRLESSRTSSLDSTIDDLRSVGSTSDHGLSDTLCPSPVDDDHHVSWPSQADEPQLDLISDTNKLRRRKKRSGYHLFSDSERDHDIDDDCISDPPSDFDPHEKDPIIEVEEVLVDEDDDSHPEDQPYEIVISGGGSIVPSWIAASLLPRYVDETSIATASSRAESCLGAVSHYSRLTRAQRNEDNEAFATIMKEIQDEWRLVGSFLLALAALNLAVFGLAPTTIFPIDGAARQAIALGSIASGIGLFIDAWFLFVYGGCDEVRFRERALGVWKTYVFFSISCRLPMLCMFLSTGAIMFFLFTVAYQVWSRASFVLCFVAGLLFGLQYWVWFIYQAFCACRRVVWRVRACFGRRDTAGPPMPTDAENVIAEARASHIVSTPSSPIIPS
ncbi:hypothetical protein JAAARDRAFT_362720 [Jaapia argillacea MUCL 33604]|uniref:C2 domain-containing protein n=1 Tax=Jaapia argillacea MUCL 33604 TaxID=933084 RepID=A0A067Q7I0_9AGAM|nr:hypothetical protein JAAARDRAFT_362720 [Jaapia argillacea MUCL 33604]